MKKEDVVIYNGIRYHLKKIQHAKDVLLRKPQNGEITGSNHERSYHFTKESNVLFAHKQCYKINRIKKN